MLLGLPTYLEITPSCWLSCGLWWGVLDTGSLAQPATVSQIVPLEMSNQFSIFQLTHSLPQTEQSPLGREWFYPPLTGGWRTTCYSLWFGLLNWSWFCLSEHRQIQVFHFLKDFADLSCFIFQAFKTSASEGLLREIYFHRNKESFKIFRSIICSLESKLRL